MYDPFLLSSSCRARPCDASIVEMSLQRFPYKYRAVVPARRAFPTKIRIDKKRAPRFFLSLFLEISFPEYYSRNHGLGSIKTRLSRDYIYKVTSTFLTGMFAINFRVTKVYAHCVLLSLPFSFLLFIMAPTFRGDI